MGPRYWRLRVGADHDGIPRGTNPDFKQPRSEGQVIQGPSSRDV